MLLVNAKAESSPIHRLGLVAQELIYDDRYTNHSDNPNTGMEGCDDMIALRDIHPGEEITCDYRHVGMLDVPGGRTSV